MGQYNGAVITAAGQGVIAQAIGGDTLEITKIVSSATAIPAGTDLTTLVSISDIEQTVTPGNVQVFNGNILQVPARFTNAGVNTAYLIQTLGVFGQVTGGSETLLAVSTAITPDQMPAESAVAPSAFIYNLQLTVQSADQITVTVDDAGTATVEDLNTLYATIDAQKLDKDGDGENVTVTFDDSTPDPDVTSLTSFKNALVSGITLKKLLSVIKQGLNFVPPKSHRSQSASIYGGGDDAYFGHVKLSDVYNSQIGTASQSIGASQKSVYDVYTELSGVVSKTANGLAPQLPDETATTKYLRQDGTWSIPPDNNTTYSAGTGLSLSGTSFSVSYGSSAGTACQGNDSRLSDSRTPTSHASTGTGYGAGNASNYGHVKVSDNYTSSAGNASQSVAASSKAVYDCYNAFNSITSGSLTKGSYCRTSSLSSANKWVKVGRLVIFYIFSVEIAAIPSTDKDDNTYNILRNLPAPSVVTPYFLIRCENGESYRFRLTSSGYLCAYYSGSIQQTTIGAFCGVYVS